MLDVVYFLKQIIHIWSLVPKNSQMMRVTNHIELHKYIYFIYWLFLLTQYMQTLKLKRRNSF